jgi:hypothetical protein
LNISGAQPGLLGQGPEEKKGWAGLVRGWGGARLMPCFAARSEKVQLAASMRAS